MSGSAERGPAPAPAEPRGDEPVELGVLGDYIGFHLRLAQAASFRAFKRHAGIPGLRPGWFAVLSLIDDNPGITPIALSRASGRDKSTITPLLRDLARDELIAPRGDPQRPAQLRAPPDARRASRRWRTSPSAPPPTTASSTPSSATRSRRSSTSCAASWPSWTERRAVARLHHRHGLPRRAGRGRRQPRLRQLRQRPSRRCRGDRRGARHRAAGARDRHLPERDGGHERRPRLRPGLRPAAGGAGACRLRHPGAGRRGAQRRPRPRARCSSSPAPRPSPRRASSGAAATSSSSGSRTCPTSAASSAAT